MGVRTAQAIEKRPLTVFARTAAQAARRSRGRGRRRRRAAERKRRRAERRLQKLKVALSFMEESFLATSLRNTTDGRSSLERPQMEEDAEP